ncbi:RNA polymerase sigma factor [Pseudobacteriovorax antillogorgiicola]|uniref:RNA polymerase sigma-70 factor, ECF subfamily n=1 Tax=Pseudobacteriovorax antillogorgiicola TaxID=1513793 RepID=A0A1Y6BDF6_9BACT|nr:RNA polymerase sigma factor [Pseudobacteriovorax antillogorgiicola]TCS56418.1 RNA polymerase sigma-70 factor (ECF subfamily) [Pseudobacteriovorax antillogorgiicola]SMF05754.1 RNA polymerase sigma-70 factor, ECF subfamily [Pseudobacteriovorax antillogorgiicola]
MKHWTDEALMQAHKAGKAEPFEELYSRYAGRILGYLKAKGCPDKDAEDLMQMVLFKVHHKRFHYDPNYPFATWVFTIVRNTLIDYFRRQKKEVPIENDIPNEEKPQVPIDLAAYQAKLSKRHQEALHLRYEQDLSFEEVAQHLGSNPVAARQIVSRAIRQLRKIIGEKP